MIATVLIPPFPFSKQSLRYALSLTHSLLLFINDDAPPLMKIRQLEYCWLYSICLLPIHKVMAWYLFFPNDDGYPQIKMHMVRLEYFQVYISHENK